MKRTRKDLQEKRLVRYLRERNKAMNESTAATFYKAMSEVDKKYGFNKNDFHRAIRLVESRTPPGYEGFFKHTNSKHDRSFNLKRGLEASEQELLEK